MTRSHRILWSLAVAAALLVAARAALPYAVKDWVNRKLAALEAYDGRVEDVDLAIWRGAYRVEGMRLTKTGSKQPEPFFDGDRIDVSIEWRSLWRGRLVAECELWRPKLNLVRAEAKDASQLGTEVNWPDALGRLSWFRFNTIAVHDGTATFRAPGIRSEDALVATDIDGRITNLTNVAGSAEETFAGFEATATVLEDGAAEVAGSANPLARSPTFDVNLTVTDVRLPQVNPWLREYIKADAEAGDFELYTELAAADGKFRGYAKPIMKNVDIYRSGEPEPNPFKRLWEGLVDFAAEVFEDQDSEQVAARIPFSGTIEDPEAGILPTIVSVMRNAFVGAFARSLEGSVSLRDVRENIRELEPGDGAKERREEGP